MLLAIIVFIIILGILIFVHELGHFVVARRNGIGAPEFGFGFPPRIFGVQKVTDLETKKTKWRIIWGRHDGDDENEIKDINEIEKKGLEEGTIYSINWIPLGGFVRIKGEDGGKKDDEDSFANKSAWTRTRVLAAGVIMNFLFAWLVISICLMIGAPEPIDNGVNVNNSKIQISEVAADSPAQTMGLKVGDEISKTQTDQTGHAVSLQNITEVQTYINSQKGEQINLKILRGKKEMDLKGTPRANAPAGQGPLGVSLMQTIIKSYPWYQAIWNGLVSTINLIGIILVALWGLLVGLFAGHGVSADVSGPVGIAIMTQSVTDLGLIYVLQFAAILSINLGIINALPIPALDGGRILFIIIEKIRRQPVSQKTEQFFHTAFFLLLILLMVLVTFHDIGRLIK